MEHPPSQTELRGALARAFRTTTSNVEIVTDMATPSDAPVVCQIQDLGGQFPLMASVYLKPMVQVEDREAVFRVLSELTQTRLLVAADSPDPYVMSLVDGNQVNSVSVDVGALDDREEYVLA